MATRPRVTIPRSYEDFQPSSNLVQEEDCETLIVDLPEFRKEQVRVQMEDRSRTLLITGERPIGSNKWSRFHKDLRVPINCNINEILAKFENGVLRIIMPLKGVPKTAPPTAVQTQKVPDTKKPIPPPPPPPPPSKKPLTETKPTPKPQIPEIPKLIWDPIITAQSPPSQKPVAGPKPMPGPLSLPSQELTAEPRPSPTLTPPPKPEPLGNERPRPKPAPDSKLKSVPKIEKEKEKELKGAQELKARVKENASHVVEDCKDGSKRLALKMDESRQYIVNMVAAVLVVVALWFYTKYTVNSLW